MFMISWVAHSAWWGNRFLAVAEGGVEPRLDPKKGHGHFGEMGEQRHNGGLLCKGNEAFCHSVCLH